MSTCCYELGDRVDRREGADSGADKEGWKGSGNMHGRVRREERKERERERARESQVGHWEKRNGRLAVL